MGQNESDEMKFWTKEEYMKFIPTMANKPYSYMAFELLYWCGIRLGELRHLLHVRCCDEAYGKMTAEELSVSSLVVSIAAASEKLRKSIFTGNLTICRPKKSSSKGNTSIKLKNVEIVSYNVIRYHRKKAADYLKSLGKRIPIEDFSARHAVKFFEEQWNQLVEKYSF